MTDLLVKLYDLPEYSALKKQLERKGYIFKRAIAPEKTFVRQWVQKHFSILWADEVDVAFSRQPVSCIVAIKNKEIAGFVCFETTSKNFFGPTGVQEKYRGEGLGKLLLFLAMDAMKEMGYTYAIIGGAGPVDFYVKTVGAIPIPGSTPGIYQNLLKN